MKAPDKIYINSHNDNDTWGSQWHTNQWHTKPSTNPTTVSHEYINKDTLLAWLKKQQFEQGFEDGEAEHGYKVAINDTINKINSIIESQPKNFPKEIEKVAVISPGALSNFGTSSFVLDIELTQEEQEKLLLVPGFCGNTIKIKILCE